MPADKQCFTVILDPEDDGGYSVHCPALPGCVSQGEDRQDALNKIKEAIELVLEVFGEERASVGSGSKIEDWLPKGTPNVVAKEIQEVLRFRDEDGRPLTIETVQLEVLYPVPA